MHNTVQNFEDDITNTEEMLSLELHFRVMRGYIIYRLGFCFISILGKISCTQCTIKRADILHGKTSWKDSWLSFPGNKDLLSQDCIH